MKFQITLDVELSDKYVTYLKAALLEDGYCNYWADVLTQTNGTLMISEHGGYDDPPTEHVLPPDWIEKGLQKLAELHYKRLPELLDEDYDAESLDALVQAAVLGELRYG